MEEKVLALTYDNKIVRIPREKLEEFKENQAKIKKLLEEGKTQKESRLSSASALSSHGR